jgi:hypothetical protein
MVERTCLKNSRHRRVFTGKPLPTGRLFLSEIGIRERFAGTPAVLLNCVTAGSLPALCPLTLHAAGNVGRYFVQRRKLRSGP